MNMHRIEQNYNSEYRILNLEYSSNGENYFTIFLLSFIF